MKLNTLTRAAAGALAALTIGGAAYSIGRNTGTTAGYKNGCSYQAAQDAQELQVLRNQIESLTSVGGLLNPEEAADFVGCAPDSLEYAYYCGLMWGWEHGYTSGFEAFHGDYRLVEITTPDGGTLYALEDHNGNGYVAYDCEGNVID